jgi:hypothetical protein
VMAPNPPHREVRSFCLRRAARHRLPIAEILAPTAELSQWQSPVRSFAEGPQRRRPRSIIRRRRPLADRGLRAQAGPLGASPGLLRVAG